MKKNKRKKYLNSISIDSIGYGGVGIGTAEDGRKIIVKGGALPNSVVDILVTKSKKDYIQGHITNIISYDPKYSDGEIFCKHYFSQIAEDSCNNGQCDISKTGCGGCKWQIMSYNKQLELKENIVLENFQRILKTQHTTVYPIVPSPLEKGYRNKIEFSFGKYITGKKEDKKVLSNWSLGFHKQGEFSKIVDIDNCGLVSDNVNVLLNYIKKLCKDSSLPVHDQKTHQGFWRHLVIREGVNTNQILVNLVVANQYLQTPSQSQLRTNFLTTLHKDSFLQEKISSLVITKNNGLADVVKGPDVETETLWGEGFIFEKLIFSATKEGGDKSTEATFRISPFSFFQTNSYGAQELFGHAAKLVGKIKGTILDLYCGTGSIGLSFLKMGIGKELVGIEIVEDAIQDAWKNATINKLKDRCFFASGPAEVLVSQLPELQQKLEDTDLVILDPPRSGLHKNVIKFLRNLRKEKKFKLLYISCNPVTMARDVDLLIQDNVFKIIRLQAVDMFPQTHHIECIGVFS